MKNRNRALSQDERHVQQEHFGADSDRGKNKTLSGLTDAFDLERLRLSQNFADDLGVKKALVTVPVRKPARQSFIRVHPDEAYRLQTAILELKEDRETFLVDPTLWPELGGEITPVELFTAVTRNGDVFLWPVKLPGPDGRSSDWHRSAFEIAGMAMTRWLRVQANMGLGAYEALVAQENLSDPQWPEASFRELLAIAFKDRFITDLDHPVVRKLRGRA
jgi:hypothetical protein